MNVQYLPVYFIYIASPVQLKACWFCAYVLLCQIINVGRPLKSFGSVVLNIQWPNATKEGKRLLYLVQIKDHRKNIIHCTPAKAINPLRFTKVVPSLDVKLNIDHLLTSAVTGSTLQLSVFDIWEVPSGIVGEIPNVSSAHSLGIIQRTAWSRAWIKLEGSCLYGFFPLFGQHKKV